MSFIVEDTGGTFERCPPGLHLARCYQIIDLGTQKEEYQGQAKVLHKIRMGWEIHGTDEDGNPLVTKDAKPFAIFKRYTLSWSDKARLRIDLQSWRGRAFSQEEMRRFDLKNVLGAWCMLNVIDKPSQDGSRMFSNVDSITPVPQMIKQAGLPSPVNKNELFNLENPDMEMFETFSQNLKATIEASPEWKKLKSEAPVEAPTASIFNDDQIPF